ncbi:M48 family metallopeptidase [Streptomyces coerulescens]|uniref:M48 family metallopeptidase n=1 Tax=Streptomyces coerulescens TaxID=29304 RepID=A0ABW0CZN6_STRCD
MVQPAVGLVLLALGGYLWPRPARLARGPLTLERKQAAELFELLDRLADAAGVRRVDVVQLDVGFSVRVATFGVRRRRVLFLGYPLWTVYGRQQRLAAVAHALVRQAHDIRDDAVIDAALDTLRRASTLASRPPASDDAADQLLRPSALSRYGDEMTTAASQFISRTRLVDWTLWVPGLAARGTRRLLLRAARSAVRDAERRADVAASRIVSPAAAAAAAPDRDLARQVAAEMHRLAVTLRTFGPARDGDSAAERYWETVRRYTETEQLGPKETVDSGAGTEAMSLDQGTADAIQGELRQASLALAETILQGDYTATVSSGGNLRT